MSGEDAVSAVALVVALVALVISVLQLLQAIFGTAEGFRRTNHQLMGPFSQTRDRVFHFTEFRCEAVFRTPHFKFRRDTSTQPKPKSSSSSQEAGASQNGNSFKRTPLRNNSQNHAEKPSLDIKAYPNEDQVLQGFITSPAVGRISNLQQFLRWIDTHFKKSRDSQSTVDISKAYTAGWLSLLDQLFERECRVHHTNKGREYKHKRLISGSTPAGSALPRSEPDPEQWHRPAMELEQRSWDLMPPDVVRPLASIALGDILTLCFRLRIEVHPEQKPWSADGFGHSFSPVAVQGLGTVVQYRFDRNLSHPDEEFPANGYFAPSEECDKLAFGIIPKNPRLGIKKDKKVNAGPNFIESIMAHFEELGIPEETRRLMREDKSQDKHFTSEALCETLLLICPPLVVDGLGIVKHVPPYPLRWAECTLRYRESYIVLLARLNKEYPGLAAKVKEKIEAYPKPTESEKTNWSLRGSQNPPTKRGVFDKEWSDQMEWVGAVLNFFHQIDRDSFNSVPSLHSKFGKNAKGPDCEELLRQLRTALDEADEFLEEKFEKNEKKEETGAYEALVTAHMEMALIRHTEVKQEERKEERDRRFKFRDETGVKGVWDRKTETVHRYIDSAMSAGPIKSATTPDLKTDVSIVGLFSKHYKMKSGNTSKFSHEVIRNAWFTMMLRAVLWGFIHFPIHLPWLPYKSRYYGDSTLVMIA